MPDHEYSPLDAVAVIGMAGRFPGARNLAEFWANLRQGLEAVTFFSDEELLRAGVDPALLAHPRYVKAKPILDDVEWFDAACFGIPAKEAELMDPQHRLFLECALEALEDGGYAADHHDRPCGIFAGAALSGYLLHQLTGSEELLSGTASAQIGIGNIQDFLATRVAYKLNLQGPAYAVQSACSTSLVAVHLATQSLLARECDLALAGGVAISVPVRSGYLHQEEGILSPDGHCRPFDAGANGTIFGSGVGVVLLKRLDEALEDADPIHAVVLGSAANNDGSLKVGFTAPSVNGQAAVITEALANANVPAETIGYIEAHGTGTHLGDPVEIAALTKAFRPETSRSAFCALGSVKANVGHLDTAAGIAGFIKTVLALSHRELPPSVNFREPHPNIDFASSPFVVSTELRPWPESRAPRRAGVSAFGVGGTNAHVVLEEPPTPIGSSSSPSPSRPLQLLLLSARTEAALEGATERLADHLDTHPELPLADVAFTLQVGRRTGEYRRCLVCRSVDDAAEKLDTRGPIDVLTTRQRTAARPVVFMFPGQGSQHTGMGAELYRHEAVFRQEVDRAAERAERLLGFDLRSVMFADARPSTSSGRAEERPARRTPGDSPLILSPSKDERLAQDAAAYNADGERLQRADCGEPALFIIEHALARLWMSWGIRPAGLVGHSVGEYAAACVAGALSLDEAITLVCRRGLLVESLEPGAMLAVALAPDELRPLLKPDMSIAAVNGPSASVVSGSPASIDEAQSELEMREIPVRRLDMRRAYHSPMVEPILGDFLAIARDVRWRQPSIPFLSNVTGRWITDEEVIDPKYWVRQLRQPVYFSDGIHELLTDPERVFVEAGPGMALAGLVRQNLPRGAHPVIVSSLPDARESRTDYVQLLTALGRLWLSGLTIDWNGFYAGERRRRVRLPTYAFDRQRYWVERSSSPGGAAAPQFAKAPLAHRFYAPVWRQAPAVRKTRDRARARTWLVFAEPGGFSATLADHLEAGGEAVIRALPGEAFGERSAATFAVSPSSPADYETLLRRLDEADRAPDAIVCAWGLETSVDAINESEAFYALLFLAQAVVNVRNHEEVELIVLSSGAHDVDGREVLSPGQALRTGATPVISQELPHVRARAIDLDLARDAAEVLCRRLQEELILGREGLVALRGPHRWVRDFQPLVVERDQDRPARIKDRGAYVILGGFGGIGLALAHYLAREARARLALIGRTPLPERRAWADWVATHPAQDEVSRRIRAIESLEAAGAEVLPLTADISSREAISRAFGETATTFGSVAGVIHAAGVAGGGLIPLRTRSQAAAVLAPKVAGTLALARALDGLRPDFVVCCSSLAALAGGVGQIDYCAANAFLDAWACSRRRAGAPVVSIDWDAWQDVGMAVTTDLPVSLQEARRDQLRFGLTTEEGIDAFCRILDQDLAQVAVSTLDFGLRLQQMTSVTATGLADRQPLSRHPRPPLQTEYVEPRSVVERQLADIWQHVLGIDRVGALDNFFDLGGDSLTAMRAVSKLKDEAIHCSIATFYAAPTIRMLAERVATGQVVHD